MLLAPLLPLVLGLLVPQSSAQKIAGPVSAKQDPAQPNVLLILVDDLGIEHVDFHPVGKAFGNPAPTLHLSQLAAESVVYTDFYATPICSASRASLLTGRHPFRHGVGRKLVAGQPGLKRQEITLPEQLAKAGYVSGAFGKWHVSFDREDPQNQGFDHYDGGLLNLQAGNAGGYYRWMRVRNGKADWESKYATSVTTDAAIHWIERHEPDPAPWFAYVAYHAPHAPFQPPPANLNPITQATKSDPDLVIYHGMIEALDLEIGRLLESVDLEHTLVILVGDNGTPAGVVQGPVVKGKAKHTTYEGGIRVPALVAGAGVTLAPGEYPGPIHIVDLFDTILDYAGAPRVDPKLATIDSVSLFDPALAQDLRWLPNRQELFSERFGPNGIPTAGGTFTILWRSIRGHRYKLLRTLGGDRLYDLQNDPWELVNLAKGGMTPAEKQEYKALAKKLSELTGNPDPIFGF